MTRLAPYFLLLALSLPFKGVSQDQTENQSIAIGLLLPDRSQLDLHRAAEMAIEEANEEGGYNQQNFKLVIRTAEGPWGAGSKESVSLVYDDHVCAIIGSLDGRNGHLAEQVATKSHLTYIETFATEPTLSQAFVPWFMRVVPNDNQQSEAILECIRQNGGGRIAILSTENYDTRYAVRSLPKTVARETGCAPLVINVDSLGFHQRKITEKILSSKIDHLIVPFDAEMLSDLMVVLGELMPSLKIYGTLHFTMGAESRKIPWSQYEGISMIGPVYNVIGTGTTLPDSRSAYLYDAVNLVILAIRRTGTGHEAITEYLSRMEHHEGITGPISFDELGNRKSKPVMVRIEQGQPIILETP